jgi:L,D-transpeptidase YcbB
MPMIKSRRRSPLDVCFAGALLTAALTGRTLLVPQTVYAQSAASAAELIRAVVLDGEHDGQRWPLLSDVTPQLLALYEGTGTPLWSRDGETTPAAALVVKQLELLDARGLSAADYDASRLRTLVMSGTLDAAASAELDVSLTVNALRALRALRFGRVSARVVHAQLGFAREAYDETAAIREMTTSTNPSLLFDAAEPPFLHYHLLKNAMARYRALALDTSLQRVTVRGTLRPNGVDSGVPQIRRVLAALGDLPSFAARAGGSDSLLYDSTLVIAMKRFQLRQGFAIDGIVGPATLARMHQPFAERVAQMALTLERWRWLPHTLGDPPPIIVNVPAFRLHAFTTNGDRESDLISMDVVVGDAFNHRTPVFSGSLQYLVFSPYWDVPPSITRREILPKARRDRGYLDRGNYEVVSNSGSVLGTSSSAVAAVAAGRARIRQKPGPTNSLGGVKFIFPNAFNVYLHDTPAQSVFSRVRRDASHGCIRVADPVRLAAFLLRNQAGWDSTRIVAAMHQSTPEQLNLAERVPVHIVYATAVAREDGVVFFYDDIYGHDKSLAALLAKGYPYAGGGR